MIDPKVKADTIAHYERMIAWVEKQPQENRSSWSIMRKAIDETPVGLDCPMCIEYYDKAPPELPYAFRCKLCPIRIMTGRPGCRGTPWDSLYDAVTWAEWLVAAREEVAFLKSLYETEEPDAREEETL